MICKDKAQELALKSACDGFFEKVEHEIEQAALEGKREVEVQFRESFEVEGNWKRSEIVYCMSVLLERQGFRTICPDEFDHIFIEW